MDNHDQSGNRALGERLYSLIDLERQKIAAAALLLSPYIPMLFMGEEYGEDVPFLYFVDHSDPELIKGVREGRKKEFEKFGPQDEPKDAVDEKTFLESKLNWEKRKEGRHHILLQWYRELIHLRRTLPVLKNFNRADVRVDVTGERSFILHRQDDTGRKHLVCFFNLSDKQVPCHIPSGLREWRKLLDSKEEQWTANKERISAAAGVLNDGKILLHPWSVIIYEAWRIS
jgi:maltooligosyltrehalose trehalohydrolase